jgi:ABC-type branched-subunit amino acid transport system substrate-binding protein
MSLAAAHVHNRAKLVQIAPTTTTPAYGQVGPYIFRMVPSDIEQARFLASVIAAQWPAATRIALVHVNDEYGRGLYREVCSHIDSTRIVADAMYSEVGDTSQLHDVGATLAAARPELILWLGRPRPLSIVWRRWRDQLTDAQVLCGDACDAALTYRNPHRELSDVHFVRFIDPAAAPPQHRAFQQKYYERTGQPAAVEAILTYDAVQLIAAALGDQVRSREDLRRYLTSLGHTRPAYVGLAGTVQFTNAGDVARPHLLALVTDSAVVAIDLPRKAH